jgi:hypothetical protein
VLNEISFKRGLLIFSNAGHNKRKWHKSSTTLQSHREHLLHKERCNACMGQFSSTKLRNEIMSKSSLRDYITCYRHTILQSLLFDKLFI